MAGSVRRGGKGWPPLHAAQRQARGAGCLPACANPIGRLARHVMMKKIGWLVREWSMTCEPPGFSPPPPLDPVRGSDMPPCQPIGGAQRGLAMDRPSPRLRAQRLPRAAPCGGIPPAGAGGTVTDPGGGQVAGSVISRPATQCAKRTALAC